ncbi:nuclear transport factor 2 family protein [Streptomyces sp. GC420]|uniref:nuclear transport factor 2 family protein n=1 Tax=Streptomyces sp. GC420 TaxID=2697568 RepID=UPI0014152B01|nr:nuclear transport factor 2 family protein [Streptomyces sp. GC420]NBM16696.1 nuclear transport factor 2 family protein [Streptomyces sp. GC420]
MTATRGSEVRRVAEGYAKAWTSGHVDEAMSHLADDMVCDAPAGRIGGVAAYRAFTQGFVDRIVSATVTKVLVDGTSAAVVYSCATPWAKDFRAMDHITVEDGRIRHITTVFDRLPAAEAAGRAQG